MDASPAGRRFGRATLDREVVSGRAMVDQSCVQATRQAVARGSSIKASPEIRRPADEREEAADATFAWVVSGFEGPNSPVSRQTPRARDAGGGFGAALCA